jgi:hypothetical protein
MQALWFHMKVVLVTMAMALVLGCLGFAVTWSVLKHANSIRGGAAQTVPPGSR